MGRPPSLLSRIVKSYLPSPLGGISANFYAPSLSGRTLLTPPPSPFHGPGREGEVGRGMGLQLLDYQPNLLPYRIWRHRRRRHKACSPSDILLRNDRCSLPKRIFLFVADHNLPHPFRPAP